MKSIMYFKKIDCKTACYKIDFDEEEVNKLIEKLKQEAIFTIHYDYIAEHGPYHDIKDSSKQELLTIGNYKKSLVEEDASKKGGTPIYHYEYDRLYYPFLQSLLDDVKKGDGKAWEEIMNPSFQKEYIPLFAAIKEEEKNYRNTNQINQKIFILEKLKELYQKVQIGEYEIPIRKYYEEAQQLFHVEKSFLTEEEEEERIYKNR